MWSSSLTLLPQLGWFTDKGWASPAFGRWRSVDPAARPVREKMPGLENPSDAQTKYLGLEQLLRHTKSCNWIPKVGDEHGQREKSPAKTLGSDEIVAKLKNERACFVPRMPIHLFPHGVGNRRISSHEGVSNPFRGSVRIQLPMRTVWVLNGVQPWVGVEWWEEERERGGEEVRRLPTHIFI